MSFSSQLVLVLRAFSGKTQRQFAEGAGIPHSQIAKYEMDDAEPPAEELPPMARQARMTVADGERIVRFGETLQRRRERAGGGADDLLAEAGERLSVLVADSYQRLLRLPAPADEPRPEDRWRDLPLWLELKELPEDHQLAVVSVSREHQTWSLVELAADDSIVEASRDLDRAASRARLAVAIAERVRGDELWCNRLKGFAAAHPPNVERIAGSLKAAEEGLEEARRLWQAGSDPGKILDPGRLLVLEASLLRDQRRFDEALARLEKALIVGRCPERYLIKKGFTLEVMGRYEEAITALLKAKPLVEQGGDSRLLYMQRFNLAVNYTHTGRHAEAAALADQVFAAATERGDQHETSRVLWLRGRIAAGLGQTALALSLLDQARREFESRGMGYDVALALLEIAVLLLQERRTREVKALAAGLVKVFESEQIHPEALAALKLFQEAVKQEEATADLARRILGYLFLARHNEELRFEG